ncbi:MAG: hypothetical protein M3Y41_08700 [Pseudomonadota bacterium]|nr:hypothetical protein [Pseudomonadota bacterium]
MILLDWTETGGDVHRLLRNVLIHERAERQVQPALIGADEARFGRVSARLALAIAN